MAAALDIVGMMGRLEPWFPGESWDRWRAVLKAAFALPMTAAEVEFFRTVADRDPPRQRVRELWCATGRRSGKDSIASLIAAYAAVTFDQTTKLRPGERAIVLCLACDRDQARIILRYIKSYFADVPALKAAVVRETADGFELNNGIDIIVGTNSFRATRGRTILLVVLDEVAYYRSETSATPDTEVYRSLVPALATLAGSMLIGISSPYRKDGLLYDKVRDHYGKNGDVLVIRAPTSALNPTIDQAIIDRALEEDPAAARAEWLGEFRDDIAGFVDISIIEAAVDRGVAVRPPRHGILYRSHVDVSGGVRDSATVAISHREGDLAVLDCVVEVKAPHNPVDAVWQLAQTLKSYRLTSTVGDKYAAGWTTDGFAKAGIQYTHSERDRSAIYLDLLPLITSGRLKLLDNKRLITQLAGLERRNLPLGKIRIDHGVGGFDDVAVSCAGALVSVASNPGIDWGRALTDFQAHLRGGFAGVLPGDPNFPHRHRHL